MRILGRVFGGPAHRRATVVIGLLLLLVAVTILSIGANSPYTHANLSAAFDGRYDRTGQIVVGATGDLRGTAGAFPSGDEAVARGASLYVTSGCAGCHALEGRGGAVAKAIAGVDTELLKQKVRGGTAGMPPFSADAISDEQIAEIGAFLRSLPTLTAR